MGRGVGAIEHFVGLWPKLSPELLKKVPVLPRIRTLYLGQTGDGTVTFMNWTAFPGGQRTHSYLKLRFNFNFKCQLPGHHRQNLIQAGSNYYHEGNNFTITRMGGRGGGYFEVLVILQR